MPIYEYKCLNCKNVFEVMEVYYETAGQSGIKTGLICPKCKHNQHKKIMSKNTFHLKGSGWYKTDYGKP